VFLHAVCVLPHNFVSNLNNFSPFFNPRVGYSEYGVFSLVRFIYHGRQDSLVASLLEYFFLPIVQVFIFLLLLIFGFIWAQVSVVFGEYLFPVVLLLGGLHEFEECFIRNLGYLFEARIIGSLHETQILLFEVGLETFHLSCIVHVKFGAVKCANVVRHVHRPLSIQIIFRF